MKKINLNDIFIINKVTKPKIEIFAQSIVKLDTSLNSKPQVNLEFLSRFYNYKNNLILPTSVFDNSLNKPILLELDLIVFKEAVKFLNKAISTWEYEKRYTVAINVSEEAVKNNKEFLDKIIIILKKYKRVDIKKIYLEINEKADYGISTFVESASKLGFGISIDDIGTQNSSITKLRTSVIPYILNKSKLKIKIDQSFIKELINTENKEKIIDEAFINMILKVKDIYPEIKIIAEGIENFETLIYLKNLNIDYGQGHYWGKPIKFTSNYLQPICKE